MVDQLTPIPHVKLRRIQSLSGSYTGRYAVVFRGEACRDTIRRQANGPWMVESAQGFEETESLWDAVGRVLQAEGSRMRFAALKAAGLAREIREAIAGSTPPPTT